MIFEFLSNKYKNPSQKFVSLLFYHVDNTYKQFVQLSVQTLIDHGSLNEGEYNKIFGYPHLKMIYAAGICAEELLPARNVLGDKDGAQFERAVIRQLSRGARDLTAKKILTTIDPFLTMMRNDPINSRLIIVDMMLSACGLKDNTSFKRVCNSIVGSIIIQGSVMDGPTRSQGIMKKSLQ